MYDRREETGCIMIPDSRFFFSSGWCIGIGITQLGKVDKLNDPSTVAPLASAWAV